MPLPLTRAGTSRTHASSCRPPHSCPPTEPVASEPTFGSSLPSTLGKEGSYSNARPRRDPGEAAKWLWNALHWLWVYSSLPSVSCCRRSVIYGASTVGLNITRKGKARYARLKTCGSVWSCPLCSLRTWIHRRAQLAAVLSSAVEQGHAVTFSTLTFSHHAGQTLPWLWGCISTAWNRLNSDRHLRKMRASHGWTGCIRRVEVTHGKNGWHIHLHVLDFWTEAPEPSSLKALQLDAWMSGLSRLGLSCSRKNGVDTRLLELRNSQDVARYVTSKAAFGESMTFELTDSAKSKKASYGNRTPWELLQGAMEGDAEARDLWYAWEEGSKGRRALLWSRGIRDTYGEHLEELDLDEPLELETELLGLSPVLWRELADSHDPTDLLKAAEQGYREVEDDEYVALWTAQVAALVWLWDENLLSEDRQHLVVVADLLPSSASMSAEPVPFSASEVSEPEAGYPVPPWFDAPSERASAIGL